MISSGLPLKAGAGDADKRKYHYGNSDVIWLMPGGMELAQSSVIGSIFAIDGKVKTISCYGDRIMPLAEASDIVKNIEKELGINPARLEEFLTANEDPFEYGGYINGKKFPDTGFSMNIRIEHGINPMYPANLCLQFGWAERHKRAGAKPPPVRNPPLRISLDPPGGKIYDEGEWLRSELGIPSPPVHSGPKPEGAAGTPPKTPPKTSDDSNAHGGRNWMLWGMLVMFLAFLTWFIRQSRKT